MQSCDDQQTNIKNNFAPPIESPEETKKEYGKVLASNAFIPPPLKRMKGSRNIFDLSNKDDDTNYHFGY